MEEYYPSLYQNFITKHIVVHPDGNRFNSRELQQACQNANLPLTHTFELKHMGILGVGINANCRREDLPPALREIATTLHDECGRDIPIERLIDGGTSMRRIAWLYTSAT